MSVGLGVDLYKDLESILVEDRQLMQHMFVIGKSGEGKSNFLRFLAQGQIIDDHGFVVIDPHGQLIDELLTDISPLENQEVVVLDAGDDNYPFGLNLFAPPTGNNPSGRTVAVDQVVQAFKKAWDGQWGIQIETWLKVIAHTFMANNRGTMADIPRLLTDKEYRATFLPAVRSNPAVWATWHNAINPRTGEMRHEEIDSTLRRISIFLMNPLLFNIVSQEKSTFDFTDFMARKAIVFIKLPVARLGEQAASLLGAVLLQQIVRAAYTRRAGSELFSVYCDEFQHFATSDLQQIIMNLRKFGVGLTLATQTFANVDETMRRAVMACGSLVVFQVTAEDARTLAPEFTWGPFQPEDIKTRDRIAYRPPYNDRYVQTETWREKPSRIEIASRLANLRAILGHGSAYAKLPHDEYAIGIPLAEGIMNVDDPRSKLPRKPHQRARDRTEEIVAHSRIVYGRRQGLAESEYTRHTEPALFDEPPRRGAID